MPDKPLQGVVVCDYGLHGAGSACGKVLTDWGAQVIKIEPFWGCPSRMAGSMLGLSVDPGDNPHHEMINSGKKSIAINLKAPGGLSLMHKILEKSNIFFSNYRLSALQKFGLDYETLSARYPALIWGHISGFGTEGPMRAEPGFDNVSYWAYSGLLLNSSDPKDKPVRNPFGGGDMMTGYVLASSMAACLYQQATSGKGQAVYTSLYGVGCWQDSCVIQAAADHPLIWPEKGDPISGFRMCKDGTWFTLGLMDYAKYGPLLARLVGHEEYAPILSERKKVEENADLCRDLFDGFFKDYTWEETHRMLKEIDMVHCKVHRPGEVAGDPQAIANGFVWEHEMRNGKKATLVSTPVKFGRQEPLEMGCAPLVGENTREVLDMLGFDDRAIAQFFTDGVVTENT